MTVPNKITYSRYVAFCVGIALVLYDQLTLSVWLIALSYLFDVVDGFIARRINQSTRYGGALDFLVDVTCVATAAVVLAAKKDLASSIPVWVACVYVGQIGYNSIAWLLLMFFAKEKSDVKTPRTNFGILVYSVQILSIVSTLTANVISVPQTLWLGSCYLGGILTLVITLKDIYVRPYAEYTIE